MKFFSTLIGLAIGLSSSAHADVWQTTRSWTPAWEKSYREWVEAEWDRSFFTKPGPYKDLKLDCADAVYSMRLAFAAENGLPFAMKDPTGGGGIISNSMKRFDEYSSAERLRRFTMYIYGLASTSSLPNDTYPAALSRKAINAGSLILTDARNHHSWTIKSLSEHGIPFLLFASRPAHTVLYERNEYPTRDFIFVDGLRPERHAGFRNFRHPEDLLSNVWDVPGASYDQYKLPWSGWSRHVQKALQLSEETATGKLSRLLGDACREAKDRVQIVKNGVRAVRNAGGQCLTQAEYDDHSTPSRDSRMKDAFQKVFSAYKVAVESGERMSSELKAAAESVVKRRDPNGSPYCPIEIGSGIVLPLGEVAARMMKGYLSSNPHDSLDARWGLEEFPGPLASQCPEY